MQIRSFVEKAVAFSDAFLHDSDEEDTAKKPVDVERTLSSGSKLWDNVVKTIPTVQAEHAQSDDDPLSYPIIDPFIRSLHPQLESSSSQPVSDLEIEKGDMTISRREYQELLKQLELTQSNEYLYRLETSRMFEDHASLNRKFETLQEEYTRILRSSDQVKEQRSVAMQNLDKQYRDVCENLYNTKLELSDAVKRADAWKQKYEEVVKKLEQASAKISQLQDLNQDLQGEVGDLRKNRKSDNDFTRLGNVNEDEVTNRLEGLEREKLELMAEVHGLNCTLQEQDATNIQLTSTINSQYMELKRLKTDNTNLKLSLESFKAEHDRNIAETSYASSRLSELELKNVEQENTIVDLQEGLKKLLHKMHERNVYDDEMVNTLKLKERINAIITSNNGHVSKMTQRKIREILYTTLDITEKEARRWGLVDTGLGDQFIDFLERG